MQNDNINTIQHRSLFINLINSNQTAQLCHRNPVLSPLYWLICLYLLQLKPFSLSKVPAIKSGPSNNKRRYPRNERGKYYETYAHGYLEFVRYKKFDSCWRLAWILFTAESHTVGPHLLTAILFQPLCAWHH